MTCNDCGRDISDCDRNGCREIRGTSWEKWSLAAATREPDVDITIGPPAPMPTEAKAQAAWRSAYILRMVDRGVDIEDATACCNACKFGPFGHDLSDDPAQAADDELSYWSDDE